MLHLIVAVPLPLVLFIITLALAAIGFVGTKDTPTKITWLVIGFVELMLALICFVGIANLFFQNDLLVRFLVPLTFSFISSSIMLVSGILLIRGKL